MNLSLKSLHLGKPMDFLYHHQPHTLTGLYLLPPNHWGKCPQQYQSLLPHLLMNTRKGKLKKNWKVMLKHRPSFGQLEPQSLDLGSVQWGEVQGAPKVELAWESNGPMPSTLDSVYQKCLCFMRWIDRAVQAWETDGLSAQCQFLFGVVGGREVTDIFTQC